MNEVERLRFYRTYEGLKHPRIVIAFHDGEGFYRTYEGLKRRTRKRKCC